MRRWLVASLSWLLLVASSARADTYEWQRTERLLQKLALTPAVQPEGRRIAWIRVVRDEVFVEDEVWPSWPNWFHATTREDVVRRELLFAAGDGYSDAAIEESMRNLRVMGTFTMVRIVPVAIAGSDEVGVLVHTRDIWSLRLETTFKITTFVEEFVIRGAERNLLGRNKTLAVDLTVVPQSYLMSEYFYTRRVWGSDVALTQRVGIYMNRELHRPEGSLWRVELGEPFYNLRQRFSWRLFLDYKDYIARGRDGRFVRTIQAPSIGPPFRDPKLAYRLQTLQTYALASVRRGDITKQTYSLGWDVRLVDSEAVAETELVPELDSWYRREVMPRGRTEIGPMLTYELFTARYATFENLSSYGQSENVRVGPTASVISRLPLNAFGSNTNSWVVQASAGLAHAAGGFWLDSKVEGRARYEGARLVDQRIELLVRGASPILFRAFRIAYRSTLELRRRDLNNTYVSLGGANGLRGYPSQSFAAYGGNIFLTNLEIRTLPIEWQAVHVGAVVFYDVGSVYRSFADARLYHSVGVGLRVLLPQFNRYPFAFDAGTSWDPGFRIVPTVSSGQIVPLTIAEDPET